MTSQHVDCARVELHRRPAQVVVQPRLALPRLAGRHVDDLAELLDRLHERRRDDAAPTHQDQHRRGERLAHHLDEARHVGGQQAAGFTDHDDAAIDEEGRGQAGIDHGTDVELVPRRSSELLDDERVVAVAHHVVEQRPYLLGHQRRVVALHEVGREVREAVIRPRSRRRVRRGRGTCP